MNHPNKDGKPAAEGEEERPVIKENTHQPNTYSTQGEVRVSQGLAGVRKAAKERSISGWRGHIRTSHGVGMQMTVRHDGAERRASCK